VALASRSGAAAIVAVTKAGKTPRLLSAPPGGAHHRGNERTDSRQAEPGVGSDVDVDGSESAAGRPRDAVARALVPLATMCCLSPCMPPLGREPTTMSSSNECRAWL
jgi:hypothetical protein